MTASVRKQALLANALIKANQQARLTWKLYEDDGTSVFTQVGENFVYLDDYRHNGTSSVKVEIWNDGALRDSFLDDDLITSGVASVTGEPWFGSLLELLHSARRASSGADEFIDMLLKDLNEQQE